VSNPTSAFIETDCLRRAGRWWLESGIQQETGGVARYYRTDLARCAPVSTEITGYAASALLFLHSSTGEDAYLERARLAGRFLARHCWNSTLATMPFELSPGGSSGPERAYFFDMGIVARGLIALWRVTRDREFLDAACRCGEAMARDFDSGTEFHPILLLPGKNPAPRDPGWSRSPGCYQLKAALAWRELAEETGREEFAAWRETALERALGSHAGFLPGAPERERVMDRLHAYCYFLEGLLPEIGRPECAAALREGIGCTAYWLAEIAPAFVRSDVYAQLLRLRLFAAALGVAPLDQAAARNEACAVAGFQVREPDPPAAGGFLFGRQEGAPLPFVNPVSTAFSIQALEMWRRYPGGDFPAGWRMLI